MAVAAPIDPKDFYIHHRKNETIVRMPGEVHGLDLMIEDLDDCTGQSTSRHTHREE